MCDTAYVLNVERRERSALAEQQVAATLLAAGAKDVTIPSVTGAVAEFDAALAAEPVPESAEMRRLRVLGVPT